LDTVKINRKLPVLPGVGGRRGLKSGNQTADPGKAAAGMGKISGSFLY
jgi:hypothetical protein